MVPLVLGNPYMAPLKAELPASDLCVSSESDHSAARFWGPRTRLLALGKLNKGTPSGSVPK